MNVQWLDIFTRKLARKSSNIWKLFQKRTNVEVCWIVRIFRAIVKNDDRYTMNFFTNPFFCQLSILIVSLFSLLCFQNQWPTLVMLSIVLNSRWSFILRQWRWIVSSLCNHFGHSRGHFRDQTTDRYQGDKFSQTLKRTAFGCHFHGDHPNAQRFPSV
jgi:hypothetical protein